MKISFELDLTGSSLSKDAQSELNDQCKTYAKDLLEEATTIENYLNQDNAPHEITANLVKRAAGAIRYRNSGSSRTPLPQKIADFISISSLLLTGFFYDSNGFAGKQEILAIFCLLLMTAAVSTAIRIFWRFEK